jgi:polysaccharide export outer membrane protein
MKSSSWAWVWVIALNCLLLSVPGQAQEAPPTELINYVRQAERSGLSESSIKQNAVAVGWTASIVDNAIATVRAGKGNSKPSNTSSAALGEAGSAYGKRKIPPVSSTRTSPAPKRSPESETDKTSGQKSKNASLSDTYVIGAGDVLQISVWKEPDVSLPTAMVRPDGKIAMPLLKDVPVSGLTPGQVEALISAGLSKFINAPDVTIVVTAINSKKVYVMGGVRKEGPIQYTYQMTVMQALSEAGGLNDYAKRKKIYVLRTENGQDHRYAFNYEEVIKGEKVEQNIRLWPGDTLVVPN